MSTFFLLAALRLVGLQKVKLTCKTVTDNTTALSTGLVGNPLSTTVVIAIPSSCSYSGVNATLYIIGGPANQTLSFTVPQCRLKRDLIVVSDSQNGNTETVNVGYQVTGLSPNTAYTAWYQFGSTVFNRASFTTKTILSAPPTVFARSGGMVVITVILSVAMFLLVVGLIAVLVLGGRGKK
ncbi:uroplakin-2 [Hyla sarda]|uniref:uroplakin-2 n=1 Tax=Hyla sarda TaxID=327740 RepID=UPI0024C345A7|nr:uroplakin-2 [Hyla sarda]